MNSQNIFKLSALSLISALSLGACGTRGDSVETNLVFSGSAQSATVASANKTFFQKLWNLSFPSAIALPPPSMIDSNGAQVSLDQAWLVFDEIRFKSEETESDTEAQDEVKNDDVRFRGPYTVDLLSDDPSPIDTAQVPAQSYRRIKMKLHKAKDLPADVPAELNDNSIYLAGAVGGVSFSFVTNDTEVFQISGPNGVTPDAAKDLVVSFELANLFKQIDLSSITSSTDISQSNRVAGANLCPSIDSSASDLYTCFRKGLEKRAKFGKDDNGDGDLDSSEDSSSNE